MKLIARLEKLEKSHDSWFLLATLVGFFLLRLPSLFEPDWYGDEGIYQVLGLAIRHGRLLYQGIFDNKPPILYLLYAIGNGDLFTAKFLSLLFGLGALIAFFFLAKKLLARKKAYYIATILFALLFGPPLLEGNIANAENFMLLPIIIAALIVTREKIKPVALFWAGVLLSLAFLIKIVAMFDAATFGFFLLIATFTNKNLIKNELTKLIPLILGFFIPIVITLLYFLLHGALHDFINATLSQNVGYVNYGNKLIIPQGLLIIKTAALLLFVLLLFIKRNGLPKPVLFIFLWVAFSLYNSFFSERPYTHYLLMLIGSFSLLCGLFFTDKKWRVPAVILVVIVLFLATRSFTWYSKVIPYYANFLGYVAGTKNTTAYQTFFDGNVPRDYEIADYLKTTLKPNDTVFIWSNDAQIYELAGKIPPGRFTVAYHITATKQTAQETQQAVKNTKPKEIVVIPTSQPFSFIIQGYKEVIRIGNADIYERNIQ